MMPGPPGNDSSQIQDPFTPKKGDETMPETLIIQSKIRDLIKAQDCSTSAEAIDAISAEVERIVQKAVERTKANGRKTVKSSDI